MLLYVNHNQSGNVHILGNSFIRSAGSVEPWNTAAFINAPTERINCKGEKKYKMLSCAKGNNFCQQYVMHNQSCLPCKIIYVEPISNFGGKTSLII